MNSAAPASSRPPRKAHSPLDARPTKRGKLLAEPVLLAIAASVGLGVMEALRKLARLLSLDDAKAGRRPQDEQQQQQQRRQQQQQERQEAKARAQAAAAGQPRPPPPKGPCGCVASLPQGSAVHPLPLSAALRKGCPPWNLKNNPDLSCAQLVPGHDVLHVRYPANSSTPSSGRRGGVLIRGNAAGLPATDALLQFDFRTDPHIDWTRGGKLGGGLQIGHGAASGYRHSATAASARLTWAANGELHLYVYAMEGTQQDPSYASVCKLGAGYGDSMFPGTFKVDRGVWNRVQIRVRLNTPGCADGVAGLGVNGHYREFDRMVWRTHADTRITEAMLLTFFGGSWSTPIDTWIDFANFSLTVLER